MEYNYYVTLLTKAEQELYYEIRNEIFKRTDYLSVFSNVETVDKVINAIMLDNPEIFWFQGKWRAKEENGSLIIAPIYTINSVDIRLLSEEIENNINKVISILPKDPLCIIRKVYEWLICNVCYERNDADQSIKGTIIDKKAVCKGIARTFQLFMNRLNIPSLLIEGSLDGIARHTWNIVIVDGKPYHIDVTLGYQQFFYLFSKEKRNMRYPCFLVSDETIYKAHKIIKALPIVCNDDMDISRVVLSSTNIPVMFSRCGNVKYLDSGSTCNVFKIEGKDYNYALKVIETNGNTIRFYNAKNELDVLNRLSIDKAVVSIIDSYINDEENQINILMPFFESLPNYRRNGKLCDAYSIIKLGIDIINALISIKNKGYLYLDIQPKNIYFDAEGKAILGDMGNCIRLSEINSSTKGIGTISFMAPEAYFSGIYSEASTIYSLGIILYSLLNDAMLPFEKSCNHEEGLKRRLCGETLPMLSSDNEYLNKCIARMCEFSVNLRYNTYTEVLADLELCHNN